VHTGFWWGCLRERDYFADLRVDGRIKFKMGLQEVAWEDVLDLCGSK
jgi:hypothetical protein